MYIYVKLDENEIHFGLIRIPFANWLLLFIHIQFEIATIFFAASILPANFHCDDWVLVLPIWLKKHTHAQLTFGIWWLKAIYFNCRCGHRIPIFTHMCRLVYRLRHNLKSISNECIAPIATTNQTDDDDGLHRVSLAIKNQKHVRQRTRTWNRGKNESQSNFHYYSPKMATWQKTNRIFKWISMHMKVDVCKLLGLFISNFPFRMHSDGYFYI